MIENLIVLVVTIPILGFFLYATAFLRAGPLDEERVTHMFQIVLEVFLLGFLWRVLRKGNETARAIVRAVKRSNQLYEKSLALKGGGYR